jgi:hypothetical protein
VVLGGLHLIYGNQNLFLYSCKFVFCVLALLVHGLGGLPRGLAILTLSGLLPLLVANNAAFAARILALLTGVPRGV